MPKDVYTGTVPIVYNYGNIIFSTIHNKNSILTGFHF